MIKREIIEKRLDDMATRVARLRRYQRLSFEDFDHFTRYIKRFLVESESR
ncbi:hypothetical protein LR032_03690 [Candidatus Bipolaricaulota bacterium]|nr:hypothetical protein [Candidatus Bipolaricaulota bacterium]